MRKQATVNIFVTFSAYQVDAALLNTIISMSTYCREVELGKDELQCGPYSDAEAENERRAITYCWIDRYHDRPARG